MTPSLGLLVQGIGLAHTIAQLLGVLESIDAKVDRWLASELKTGMLELQQAMNSDTESTELLRSARQRFNKAITLESGYKLCLSYVGLAVCHGHLKDRANATKALHDAIAVETSISTKDWIVSAFIDNYNPRDVLRRAKKRKPFDFRGAIKETVSLFKKEAAIGSKTENILEDRRRLMILQDLAKTELNTILFHSVNT